jgi:hypothetical protein
MSNRREARVPRIDWLIDQVVGFLSYDDDDLALQYCVQQRDLGNCCQLVDATDLRTPSDIFDTFSETFEFPGYFGRNWDALAECISDLSWLSGNSVVLIISRSSAISDGSPDHRVLLEILLEASSCPISPHADAGPSRRLSVIFADSPPGLTAIRSRIESIQGAS